MISLGSNEWNLVTTHYNENAKNCGRMVRDIESLKRKFEIMAGNKKPTGDPFCPQHVRRTQQIGCDMLGRSNAGTVRSSKDDDKPVEEVHNGENSFGEMDGEEGPSRHNARTLVDNRFRDCAPT